QGAPNRPGADVRGRGEGRDDPVEKAAPVARRAGKQPIHARREPQDSGVLGQGAGALARAAGELDLTLAGAVVWRLIAMEGRARGNPAVRPVNIGRDGKAGGAAAQQLLERGAAKTTARGEERNRLEKVGLARAVGPGEHQREALGLEP